MFHSIKIVLLCVRPPSPTLSPSFILPFCPVRSFCSLIVYNVFTEIRWSTSVLLSANEIIEKGHWTWKMFMHPYNHPPPPPTHKKTKYTQLHKRSSPTHHHEPLPIHFSSWVWVWVFFVIFSFMQVDAVDAVLVSKHGTYKRWKLKNNSINLLFMRL